MGTGGLIWSLAVIVAPIILIVAVAWAMLHNRTTRCEQAARDAATRRLYEKDVPPGEATDHG